MVFKIAKQPFTFFFLKESCRLYSPFCEVDSSVARFVPVGVEGEVLDELLEVAVNDAVEANSMSVQLKKIDENWPQTIQPMLKYSPLLL